MKKDKAIIKKQKKYLKQNYNYGNSHKKKKKIEHIKKLLMGDFDSKYKYFRMIDQGMKENDPKLKKLLKPIKN